MEQETIMDEVKIVTDTTTIRRILDRLRRECNIRDPQRRNGYLTAILEVQNEIWNLEENRYS